MDKRKNYFLTIDTETTNGLDDPLVYDIGGIIHDKKGNVYETFSFVINEVFNGMKDLMQTAYYAKKIPDYIADIKTGKRKAVGFFYAKRRIYELCDKYNIRAIIAYNMYFDYRALTNTQRYLTKSKFRYFFSKDIELWCSLRMAESTICKQKNYMLFCRQHNHMVNQSRPRKTAEVVYRYVSGQHNFEEEHKGLEDCYIEKEIFTRCISQKKKMRKLAFNRRV